MANMDPYWPEHWEMNTYGPSTIKGPRGRLTAPNSSGVRGGYKEIQTMTQDQADRLIGLVEEAADPDISDQRVEFPFTANYAEELIDAINKAVDE